MIQFFCRSKNTDAHSVLRRNPDAFRIVEDGNGWFVYDTAEDYDRAVQLRRCPVTGPELALSAVVP